MRDEVTALVKKYGVKVVFSGHRHISTRSKELDGMTHIVHPVLVHLPHEVYGL